jgi:hypothetical protein
MVDIFLENFRNDSPVFTITITIMALNAYECEH